MAPPTGAPAVSPAATTLETAPRACPRRSRGKTWVTMAGPIDIMAAAPSAWTPRAATSAGSDHAEPHSPEPRVKRSIPPVNTRRRPSTSPSRPDASSAAEMTSR